MPLIPGTANLWQLTSECVLFGKEKQHWPWLGSTSPAPVTSHWKLGAANASWTTHAGRTSAPSNPTPAVSAHGHLGLALMRSASVPTGGCLVNTPSLLLGKGCSTRPRVSWANYVAVVSCLIRVISSRCLWTQISRGRARDSYDSRSRTRSAQLRSVSSSVLIAGLVFGLKKGKNYSKTIFGVARQPLLALLCCSCWTWWPGKNTSSLKTPVCRNIQASYPPLKSKQAKYTAFESSRVKCGNLTPL